MYTIDASEVSRKNSECLHIRPDIFEFIKRHRDKDGVVFVAKDKNNKILGFFYPRESRDRGTFFVLEMFYDYLKEDFSNWTISVHDEYLSFNYKNYFEIFCPSLFVLEVYSKQEFFDILCERNIQNPNTLDLQI